MMKTRGPRSTSAISRDRISPLSTHHKPVSWDAPRHGRSGYLRDPAAHPEAFIDAVAPFLHHLDAKPARKVAP